MKQGTFSLHTMCGPACAVIIALAIQFAGAAHLRKHPQNPKIFEFRGKPLVLVSSAEHYGAVMNLDFDYKTYLDEMVKEGLNMERLFTGYYVEEWNMVNGDWFPTNPVNPLNPAPNRFICPWVRSDVAGYKEGGNKFDMSKFDPAYFARLKDFLTEAGKREIIVEIDLFSAIYQDVTWEYCPANPANNINNLSPANGHSPYDLGKADHTAIQEAMVRKFAEELRDVDNMYYEICNEYSFDADMQWHNRMAEVLRDAEKDFPNKHLIGIDLMGTGDLSQVNPALYDIVNIHFIHFKMPENSDILMETEFLWGTNENEGDPLMRHEGWQCILGGGAIFNNLDWYFTVSDPKGAKWQDPPGGPQGKGSNVDRLRLRYVREVLNNFDIVKMKPRRNLLKNVPSGCWGFMLAEEGKAYVAYMHIMKDPYPFLNDFETSFQANVSIGGAAAGSYTVEWIDTKTGEVAETGQKEHAGGDLALASPSYKGDIVLTIREKNYKYSAPVTTMAPGMGVVRTAPFSTSVKVNVGFARKQTPQNGALYDAWGRTLPGTRATRGVYIHKVPASGF
jgi:hypothetical protein